MSSEVIEVELNPQKPLEDIRQGISNIWVGAARAFNVNEFEEKMSIGFDGLTGSAKEMEILRNLFLFLIECSTDGKIHYFRNADFRSEVEPTVSIEEAVTKYPPDEPNDTTGVVMSMWVVKIPSTAQEQ